MTQGSRSLTHKKTTIPKRRTIKENFKTVFIARFVAAQAAIKESK